MARGTGVGRFVWITGRRRVGKSRLVQEFLAQSQKAHVYFTCPRHRGTEQSLAHFATALRRSSLPAAATAGTGTRFESWREALRIAGAGASPDRPAVIVIDELPYLVESDAGVASDIQEAWDRELERLPVVVIAIGSDVRMMRLLTGYAAELHGRPTRELHVKPFNPAEIAEMTGTEGREALDRYLLVGGYPSLARSWPAGVARSEFLAAALEDSATPLVVNGIRIMEAELEAETYTREVLEAIGAGAVSFQRIRDRSGVGNEATLSAALTTLAERKGLITVELPYAVPPGRKLKRYTVDDPYLRFWLHFLSGGIDEIDRGRSDLLLERIEQSWSTWRGRAMEPIVSDSLERMLADPETSARFGGARVVGSYWNRTGTVEVDLVGGDGPDPERIGFVGSIKWRDSSPFDGSDAAALAAQRAHVPGAESALLVAASATGAEAGVGVDHLLGPDEILAAWE